MTTPHRSRPVAGRALDRLSRWAARRPRIALMGEFSSGKSTLLNCLIGEDLLPTRVTATELPPVWFGHGEPRAFWVDREGRHHPLGFGEFGGVPRSARYVRVLTPAPILDRCDIIDTPGISDPNLEEESWRFPVGQASFVLWCTPATQAWRETERSTWLSLPERLRAQSLLVVTRADKLSLFDREKVARRLSRESAGLFGGTVFLSSLDAVRGRAELSRTGESGLWEASGGGGLMRRIEDGIASVQAHRLALLRRRLTAETPATPALGEDAPAAPLRLVQPPEPVRPRRVELPDIRRSERPPADLPAPDPLDEIRAGWMALRSPEPEPAPVLRLTDPIHRPEPGAADRALADRALADPVAAATEEPAPETPAEAQAEAQAAEVHPQAEALPRAVRIWRDIVARTPEMPPNSPVLVMIDQLLFELSRDREPSDVTGPNPASSIERNQAA